MEAKAIAREARRAAEIAQGWNPTGTFPFARLPRELRDYIYEYAFGPLPTVLKTKGLIIQATHKDRPSDEHDGDDGDASHFEIRWIRILPAFVWGIPMWVLTNKQICSEALSHFGSSHTFNAVDIHRLCRFHSECGIFPELPGDHWGCYALGQCEVLPNLPDCPYSNPLVFNSEVLRNITIAREFDQYMEVEDAFMGVLNRACVKDASVELSWQVSRLRDSKGWEEDLDAWIAEWNTKQWDGKLRKVKITIPTNWTSKNPVLDTGRFEQVEALARRLVGQDGVATWGSFEFGRKFPFNGGSCTPCYLLRRSLVVERDY